MQHAFLSIREIKVFDKIFYLQNSDSKDFKELFLSIKKELFSPCHPYEDATQEISRIINELESISDKSLLTIYPNDPWSKIMDWEEIIQASLENEITIGSHSLDHSLIGKMGDDEIRKQLLKSKQEIEEHTLKPCLHFCYPNGLLPPNPAKHLQESGYASAVTTKTGITTRDNFDRYLIKRYHLDVHQGEFFNLALISGLIAFTSKYSSKFRLTKRPGQPNTKKRRYTHTPT
jgi:hypothetical protein